MEFCTFASGSSGNCALVSCGSTHILVDAGISFRRIAFSLRENGLGPDDLTGIIITHEHTDHVSGIGTLSKYCPVPIYAPKRSASFLLGALPNLEGRLRGFEPGSIIEINEIEIHSFPTPHDTPESVGYKITDGNDSFAVVTDLGFVPDSVFEAISGAGAVLLEANHDIEMLRTGRYPAFLKKRILGDRGHLSNGSGGILARRLIESGTKRIVLAHLSKENNLPELAYSTVDDTIRPCGAVAGRDYDLSVAPRDVAGRRYVLGEGPHAWN